MVQAIRHHFKRAIGTSVCCHHCARTETSLACIRAEKPTNQPTKNIESNTLHGSPPRGKGGLTHLWLLGGKGVSHTCGC